MALTCDVLTLSMMKIKIDNDLRAGTVILYPKMETVGSDYVRPETSAGVKILPLRNGIHSNNGLITTKAVFPEEKYSHDVLASVQREGFLGFPKAEKYEMTMELQTTTEDENHFTTEIFTESPLISMDEIKKALMLTAQELKKKNMAKTNSDPNSLMPAIERSKVNNIESHTTIAGDVYVPNGENSFTTYSEMSSELPIKIADEIQEPHVSDKSSNIIEAVTQQNKLDSERYTLRRTANQKKEDEMQIKNAKYKFSTSQNDGISDLLHERTESRQDGKVTGSYTYSDGFLLRRVKYVADKNGYRIISEESVPLLGNGPKVNPEGTADIKSEIGGHPVHYVIRGKDLPQRTLRYQGKGRI